MSRVEPAPAARKVTHERQVQVCRKPLVRINHFTYNSLVCEITNTDAVIKIMARHFLFFLIRKIGPTFLGGQTPVGPVLGQTPRLAGQDPREPAAASREGKARAWRPGASIAGSQPGGSGCAGRCPGPGVRPPGEPLRACPEPGARVRGGQEQRPGSVKSGTSEGREARGTENGPGPAGSQRRAGAAGG